MMQNLSNAAMRLKGQPMFKLLAKIQEMEQAGYNIIHFEIGDPDFATPLNITEAAVSALYDGKTHYTNSLGIYEFRKAIAEYIERTRGFLPELNQIAVMPSANMSIYYAVQCLTNPKDEVIVQDPGFPTYDAVLSLCDVKRIPICLKEKNDFCLDPDDFEAVITPRTKMLILNSPHNPTGAVISSENVKRITQICIQNGIYLFSDEVYARMIYESEIFFSPALVDKCLTNVILSTGFSKAFAMTGWRLGFMVAPKAIVDRMGLMVQTTVSCVSSFIQYAGLEALQGSQDSVSHMMSIYKKRRDLLVEGLNSISGITCQTPHGAFYVYPNIMRTKMTSREFAEKALNEAHVGLLPGTDFGDSGEGYVRLCYATEEKNIVEGIHRLKDCFG